MRILILPLLLSTFPGLSPAAQSQDTDAEAAVPFEQCVSDLKTQAKSAGIDSSTISLALDDVKKIDKVIEYDRNQPEFVQTFPNYLNKRVTDWRVEKGRELFAQHRELLAELANTYGIPAHYLVAFWGLETNFGAYKGKMPIIDSLTTLACDPRRSSFFTQELLTAMRLMERERLNKAIMLGSWAGAMGHTQFMPSAYLRYAVDGDQDGTINLWDSETDALTSAANFLSQLGWRPGFRWGREVLLSDKFDYSLAGKDQQLPLSQWAEKGVMQTDKQPLPDADISASLLVPAGHTGPAFLVYGNFDIIMRWNNSESYAISVGYLADRIAGKGPLVADLPDLPDYPIAKIQGLQADLNQLGFDVGEPDGIMGPATRKGIRNFQAAKKVIADGFPDQQLFELVEQALKVRQGS